MSPPDPSVMQLLDQLVVEDQLAMKEWQGNLGGALPHEALSMHAGASQVSHSAFVWLPLLAFVSLQIQLRCLVAMARQAGDDLGQSTIPEVYSAQT